MTERRNSEYQTKVHQGKTYHGVASLKGGAWTAASKTAYREEFQRDYSLDPDEPLNGTESQDE